MSKPIYTIYLVTNTINNKQYIGQTNKTCLGRWKNHCNSSKRGDGYHLHRSIAKYGQDTFKIHPIYCTKIVEHISPMEQYFIREYDTFKNGYNLTMGGEGSYGWNPSSKPDKYGAISERELNNHKN